jgi:A/G-specific adenine glycosylase
MQRSDPPSQTLLHWYDRHARSMPWRVPPGDRQAGVGPDPYHVWLSEVMLQQTTVAAVRDYWRRFVARWPTVGELARAVDGDVMAEWAGLGYYARARNLLKCARAVAARPDGQFPQTRDGLLALPGIGPYTAAAVAAIAFDEPATVVDGNVERVMARIFAVTEPVSVAKRQLIARAESLTPLDRPGDYAQAVMDLGATICTPRNPVCPLCPWQDICAARAQGLQSTLPTKAVKMAKPSRQGTVWAAFRHDGALLLEDRPASGLLGGMLGLPGDGWDGSGGLPPLDAEWHSAGEVRHVFTHFSLTLLVMVAQVSDDQTARRGRFVADCKPTDLPTLMRKARDLAAAALDAACTKHHPA